MKFKSIFILFSILLLLFFVILVFLPQFMLGSSVSAPFWRSNWPLILVWLLLFGAINAFYIINRKLFLLLEKEDWPALSRYLEEKVIQNGRYSPRLVRLLANTYLVLSDSASVMSLENKIAIVRPSLVDANALVFGTARILGKDISGAIRFFETRKASAKGKTKDWICWYHGFALLLDRKFEEAGGEFSLLARMSTDGVVTGLSSYFLSAHIAGFLAGKGPEFREIASSGRERVKNSMSSLKDWKREVTRLSTEIHAAAISKYLEETGRWLYGPGGEVYASAS